LEGVLTLPEGTEPFAGVLMCHPHPQQSGNMRNNVVEGVCRALDAVGIATLRFNFRGVGGSQGQYSGGPGEQDDALGALTFLSSSPGIDPARVGMAGYSFGSRITVGIASGQTKLRAVAFIAPTTSTIAEGAALAGFGGPKFFISGSRDRAVDHEELRRFVGDLPEPSELYVAPDIDHFWWGAEALLRETIAKFFTRAFDVKPGSSP